ncbi:MAG: glycosyltransferase family 2 protein [Elusimicrobiota bacterium]|nr:glycosyltransferase family 2 protein [Elusimicrobiota bacterium]
MAATASPRVCICVPVYNAAATLAATLDSILSQTYKNISVIIVDNASTDNSMSIADRYAALDGRVLVLRHRENVGAEGNFTRCLQLASGDYTAIYHSDDIYSPSMAEEQVSFLELNPEAGAVFTMAAAINENGSVGRVYRLPKELRGSAGGLYGFPEIFKAMLKYGNFLFCPSVMVRTPVYRDYIRKWDAGDYLSAADGDVWLRIALRYKVGIIDKPLLKYRISDSSFSYHAARRKTGPHDMFKLFDDYLKGPASGIAGEKERNDYALLVLKDNINRSYNLLLLGKRKEARVLLQDIFSTGIAAHALKSLTHTKVILYGYALFILSLVPLSAGLKKLLFRLRF